MTAKYLQSYETLLKNIQGYFLEYSFLEFSLTNEEKPCMLIKSSWDEVSLDCSFNIEPEFGFILTDNEGKKVEIEDIWRHLFVNAMDSYEIVMNRLLKKE